MPYSNPIIRKTKQQERNRKSYQKNKDNVLKRTSQYRKNHLELYRKYTAKWRENNPNYKKERYKTNLLFKLRENLRTRVYIAIKNNHKAGSAVRDLGCSIEEFKEYIENKFQLGMSWNNWGEWHLDHIIPLSSFNLSNREQFLKACHYTNYQPLWAIDNLKKSNKVI